MEGFEPPLPYENYALNVARLPIPPHRLIRSKYSGFILIVNAMARE